MLGVPMRGEWIATSDPAGTVMFWRLTHGMTRPLAYTGDVVDLTFSHNERFLALAERAGGVRIFDPEQGREIAFVQVPLAPQAALKYHAESGRLAARGGRHGRAALHRTSDWTLLPERTLKRQRQQYGNKTLFHSRRQLPAGDRSGTVRRFEVSPWTALPSLKVSSMAEST
jgi:hypothetical protein